MGYRILSLDGGGPWALIEVMALIDLFGAAARGNTVLAEFDLVAGNSGGSIVLAGLVEDLTLGEMRDLLRDPVKVGTIFRETQKFLDGLLAKAGLGPKYREDTKLAAFQALMPQCGGRDLTAVAANIARAGRASPVRLLIIGFDYDRNRAQFFRSAASGGAPGSAAGSLWGHGQVGAVTLAEAVHASTNAPVAYFDGPATFGDETRGRFWDGGVTGANNPAMAAVVEALASGVPAGEIFVFSLGTGGVALPSPVDAGAPTPFERAREAASPVADVKKLATAIVDDPPDVATYVAHVVTLSAAGAGDPGRVVRMSPLISPFRDAAGAWGPPAGMSQTQFEALVKMPMDAIAGDQLAAIRDFADLWVQGAVRNQPIRMDLDTLRRELGQETYPAARAAWVANMARS